MLNKLNTSKFGFLIDNVNLKLPIAIQCKKSYRDFIYEILSDWKLANKKFNDNTKFY